MKKQNVLRVLDATIGRATASITLAALRLAADSESICGYSETCPWWFKNEKAFELAAIEMNDAVQKVRVHIRKYKVDDVPVDYVRSGMKFYYTTADYHLREAALHHDVNMEKAYRDFDNLGLVRFCMYLDRELDIERGESE